MKEKCDAIRSENFKKVTITDSLLDGIISFGCSASRAHVVRCD
jgi:hypothetical protein